MFENVAHSPFAPLKPNYAAEPLTESEQHLQQAILDADILRLNVESADGSRPKRKQYYGVFTNAKHDVVTLSSRALFVAPGGAEEEALIGRIALFLARGKGEAKNARDLSPRHYQAARQCLHAVQSSACPPDDELALHEYIVSHMMVKVNDPEALALELHTRRIHYITDTGDCAVFHPIHQNPDYDDVMGVYNSSYIMAVADGPWICREGGLVSFEPQGYAEVAAVHAHETSGHGENAIQGAFGGSTLGSEDSRFEKAMCDDYRDLLTLYYTLNCYITGDVRVARNDCALAMRSLLIPARAGQVGGYMQLAYTYASNPKVLLEDGQLLEKFLWNVGCPPNALTIETAKAYAEHLWELIGEMTLNNEHYYKDADLAEIQLTLGDEAAANLRQSIAIFGEDFVRAAMPCAHAAYQTVIRGGAAQVLEAKGIAVPYVERTGWNRQGGDARPGL